MAELIAVKYASKAAGVYREIIDATQSSLQYLSPANVVVVIQSEHGPVMKPIYCADITQLHTMFGERDARLEGRGNFGILMAEHVLEHGPIWVLNIKNINPQSETLMVKKLACSKQDKEGLYNAQINQVYDTNKFWNIAPVYGTYGDHAALSFSSVLNGTSTVLVRKYEGRDYDYTVGHTKQFNERYLGQGLDDNDLVSDHLIEVTIFKSDLLQAKINVDNAIVSREVNLSKLNEIKKDANSKYFATYVGSIGNVIDVNGRNLNITKAINADTYAHGIYSAVNMDSVMKNGLDLLGKAAFVFDESGATLPTVSEQTRLGHTFVPTKTDISIEVNKQNRNEAYFKGVRDFNKQAIFADLEKTLRLSDVTYVGNEYSLGDRVPGTIDAPVQENGEPFPKNSADIPMYPSDSVIAGQAVQTALSGKLLHYYENEDITKGEIDITLTALGSNTEILLSGVLNGMLIDKSVVSTGLNESNYVRKLANDIKILFSSVIAGLNVNVEVTGTFAAPEVKIEAVNVPKTCKSLIVKTIYQDTVANIGFSETAFAAYSSEIVSREITLPAEYNEELLTEMYGDSLQIYKLSFDAPLSESADEDEGEMKTYGNKSVLVADTNVSYILGWNQTVTTTPAHVLTGIKSIEKHFVNGTSARQNSVLNMMISSGIVNSFTDPTIFKCRYMVDTFKTYIEPNAKHQFATIAGNAKRFLVFTPGPFYHELLSSKNPDFHDYMGQFQMSYVKNGSNPDKPSTNSFSFALDTENSKYLVPVMNGYYNDGFSETLVPYVGALAKLYYSKHTGTKKVYDIVAGQDWPLSAAGMAMPEFEPDINERASMEQIGLNVVQKLNGVQQLRSNKTAFQFVSSAFNYPETLEKVFFVSDMVEPTLEGKMFKYNNADTRLAVRKKADDVCDLLVADGAISSYVNTCDLSNNDIDVRREGIIILDTEMYNEFGIRIVVHRSTIRTEETSN